MCVRYPLFGLAMGVLGLVSGCASGALRYEQITLDQGGPPAKIDLLYRAGVSGRRPVILMLGGLDPNAPPIWSPGLLADGCILAAFTVEHPPDPDPARRPQWLYFDQRFAHGYTLMGARVPTDAGRVIDYLAKRPDVDVARIGWIGSSSTGIPGLAVAVADKRLKAVVAFVSTGAYQQWFETWHTNGLWQGKTPELWPETLDLLRTHDPILHVDQLYPCAVLLVSGGDDKVVDPRTARAFVNAARPYYAPEPERLRLVIYEGFGHNLPLDVVRMYTEHWFRLYLAPQRPPAAEQVPQTMDAKVRATQINAAPHSAVVGAQH